MSNNHFYKLLFNTQEKKLSAIIDQEIAGVPYDIFRRCSKIEPSTAKSISTSILKTKDVKKWATTSRTQLIGQYAQPRWQIY